MEAIYQCLQGYIARHGYAPTYREIATACGIASIASVKYWLDRLAEQGRVRFERGGTRTIVLLEEAAVGEREAG
jgi:repressor LexA